MEPSSEPSIKGGDCSYCGDAQVNHTLHYLESFFSSILDHPFLDISRYAPIFLRRFADRVPYIIFEILALFKLVRFSSDISKANTFRSKVIWEEAHRRGIKMEQIIFFGKPLEHYRAKINGKRIYFESIPLRPESLDMKHNWDDKAMLKQELLKNNIPVPKYFVTASSNANKLKQIYDSLTKPIIVKPRAGSRGRHTITNINSFEQLLYGVKIASQISRPLIIEEHLVGYVCRATLVDGQLVGFYRGQGPTITGDGQSTIGQLIREKDANRPNRVEPVRITQELHDHLSRSGYTIDNILPANVTLPLSHRIGRLFGGTTREMLNELHPSFVPFFEKAARMVELSVVGFDCIIPDPTKDAHSQRWGIIECNTLPFIDLHYYALEGKPQNIAGLIWDMWK